MRERNISYTDIEAAFSHPIKIQDIKLDNLGRPSQRLIGEHVEVVINPQTNKIVSVNPTSSKKIKRLKKWLKKWSPFS